MKERKVLQDNTDCQNRQIADSTLSGSSANQANQQDDKQAGQQAQTLVKDKPIKQISSMTIPAKGDENTKRNSNFVYTIDLKDD